MTQRSDRKTLAKIDKRLTSLLEMRHSVEQADSLVDAWTKEDGKATAGGETDVQKLPGRVTHSETAHDADGHKNNSEHLRDLYALAFAEMTAEGHTHIGTVASSKEGAKLAPSAANSGLLRRAKENSGGSTNFVQTGSTATRRTDVGEPGQFPQLQELQNQLEEGLQRQELVTHLQSTMNDGLSGDIASDMISRLTDKPSPQTPAASGSNDVAGVASLKCPYPLVEIRQLLRCRLS